MKLTEENFLIYAASSYTNSNCVSTEEFLEDMRRIHLIKKLFVRYKKTDEINERLVLNHLVTLYNVFSARQCTRMLFFQLDGYWDILKPFLIALNYLPDRIDDIDGLQPIITNDIIMNYKVCESLKSILREGQ
jgi:hypothetical protein